MNVKVGALLGDVMEQFEKDIRGVLAAEQRVAIMTASCSPVTVITGGNLKARNTMHFVCFALDVEA